MALSIKLRYLIVYVHREEPEAYGRPRRELTEP